jgi:hypothetical protein
MPCENTACTNREQFKVRIQCLGCNGTFVTFLCAACMADPGPLLAFSCSHGPKRVTPCETPTSK